MPRIVPIQLLKCLKVLLNEYGGILSINEVKRIASLMTKYSKKLVSKCIYVQILKATKTELLVEFMAAGGWSLVYTWLNDGIRAGNWPLVQELLELLLLCPVDVHRLKINAAPKLVKGLCKDAGTEGIRILARRLVEQWLKVVTENPEAAGILPNFITNTPPTTVTNINDNHTDSEIVISSYTQINQMAVSKQTMVAAHTCASEALNVANSTAVSTAEGVRSKEQTSTQLSQNQQLANSVRKERDPLGAIRDTPPKSYGLTTAQRKANERGLVYKIIVQDGQQLLAKIAKTVPAAAVVRSNDEIINETENIDENVIEEDDGAENEAAELIDIVDNANIVDDDSSSFDKMEKESENSNSCGGEISDKTVSTRTHDEHGKEIISAEHKERKSYKDDNSRRNTVGGATEKDKEGESKYKSSPSSSSGHKSSSHKSSSSKSSSSSSHKSSSKSSSSSSSSHRSSNDKHRSDKERYNSHKDKERCNSSCSNNSGSSKDRSNYKSSSSSHKDRHRDKEREKSSGSSSSIVKTKERDGSDKHSNASSSSNAEKLSNKVLKKSSSKDDTTISEANGNKSLSITIPNKKASISIEIRKDSERTKTVKTYKSQFRSHGLTEEAPPPPSRKALKKSSNQSTAILPASLPSSLKRPSPPPPAPPSQRDSIAEKKAKIDMNSIPGGNDKPGAIKLIPPKKIQTLVETNFFSDALSAATGPKKLFKRKRANASATNNSNTNAGNKDASSPMSSPDLNKVAPLKFYQDTLEDGKTEETKPNLELCKEGNDDAERMNDCEDDDDIPLKKVKEDIEQKVAKEKTLDGIKLEMKSSNNAEENIEDNLLTSNSGCDDGSGEFDIKAERKPGPGCGPNGPPGVLMLHRRPNRPKKKLTWHPPETLEQIRYFELDETERVNVTKTSFIDMKNLERFSERDAIIMSRRGTQQNDNMEVQMFWRPLLEVDDVPPHPDGSHSLQRKIQAEREMTTLRALYFSHAMIPDSATEAEIEPMFSVDIPVIPLDDITGNPDAVNDFTSMPWPEPKGSPKHGDLAASGTGGLGSPVHIFDVPPPSSIGAVADTPFNPYTNPFENIPAPTLAQQIQIPPAVSANPWQNPPNMGPMMSNCAIIGHHFNNNANMSILPPNIGPNPILNNCQNQNYMNQFGANGGHFSGPSGNHFIPPHNNIFNNAPNLCTPIGPMGPGPMLNGMGAGSIMNNNGPIMNPSNNRGNNSRNNGNWRSNSNNYSDNGGCNNWRSAGSGPSRGTGNNNNNGVNGVCKAYLRGNCRLGKVCHFIHPKSKRI